MWPHTYRRARGRERLCATRPSKSVSRPVSVRGAQAEPLKEQSGAQFTLNERSWQELSQRLNHLGQRPFGVQLETELLNHVQPLPDALH